jgi:hypothetical protein
MYFSIPSFPILQLEAPFTPWKRKGVLEVELHSFFTSTLDGGPFATRKEEQYPLMRRLGKPRPRSERI